MDLTNEIILHKKIGYHSPKMQLEQLARHQHKKVRNGVDEGK